MHTTESAEVYITERYRAWRDRIVPFDYKHKKGARIAQIFHETGGLERRALEVGVGPAAIAVTLSRTGMKVIGMDLSPDALERAKAHSRSHNVALLRASGFRLPFSPGTFRLIYASQVMHLFDAAGRLELLQEVHRVLPPGGRFVFDLKNVWSHPWRYLGSTHERRRRNFPAEREITELLQRAGFADVSIRPGVLPLTAWTKIPNLALFRFLSHTTFFIARRA